MHEVAATREAVLSPESNCFCLFVWQGSLTVKASLTAIMATETIQQAVGCPEFDGETHLRQLPESTVAC